jgi:hypothetical protein
MIMTNGNQGVNTSAEDESKPVTTAYHIEDIFPTRHGEFALKMQKPHG